MSDGRRSPRGGARWSQNFLVNTGVARAIVDAAVSDPSDRVLEIGPGRGALTRELVARAARVVALEIDPLLAETLRQELGERLHLVVGDATRANWDELLDLALAGAPPPTRPVRLVGNLPYAVATPILLRYLDRSAAGRRLGSAVVMVQAEVADRLAAGPGSKVYGSLGALAQATHEIEPLIDVAPGSFRPIPRVSSRVIRLTPRTTPAFAPHERARCAAFVQHAFRQRRKQLATALAGTQGLQRERWRSLLVELGCSATARAEDLQPTTLIELCRRAASLRGD